MFTKGAVERVIGICSNYYNTDGPESECIPADMDQEFRDDIVQNMEVFAGLGLRVLALASRKLSLSSRMARI